MPLKNAFDCLSENVEGVQVLRLTNSSNGGAFRLLEEYDVIPAYISKKEAKAAFLTLLTSQRNAGAYSLGAGGGNGLDFVSFIKFMVLVAVLSLSKTSSFSALYSTVEAKVSVMLEKWGLADGLKLQVVKNNLRMR